MVDRNTQQEELYSLETKSLLKQVLLLQTKKCIKHSVWTMSLRETLWKNMVDRNTQQEELHCLDTKSLLKQVLLLQTRKWSSQFQRCPKLDFHMIDLSKILKRRDDHVETLSGRLRWSMWSGRARLLGSLASLWRRSERSRTIASDLMVTSVRRSEP